MTPTIVLRPGPRPEQFVIRPPISPGVFSSVTTWDRYGISDV